VDIETSRQKDSGLVLPGREQRYFAFYSPKRILLLDKECCQDEGFLALKRFPRMWLKTIKILFRKENGVGKRDFAFRREAA